MAVFGFGKSKRGLASASEETRKRVARLGGEAHGKRRSKTNS